ncbi:unnamed protein product [Angiostrongylus costaricensis]|uniref:MATH domain-containing protein n=1 Tax=Angiostrongylus costaricensis TaxID=334426 RepID=A0A158PEY9_ANGCS|nr:unnamed protein product [Angiostrongylus costaricensis]
MVDTLCSPCKRINGVPWRIMVMPKQHMVQKKNQKCMGFFLQCCPDNTYSDAWTCQSVAEMRLIAQKPGVQNFVRKTTHVYSAKENDWGYSCFMTWADVLDESQGYIKDDRVTLEITVKAEAPKNMMSREDFRRSIDQWYNLAEMQLARGQVDLSIEANAQALKFCKDKDKQSQEKLEAQRERLVNHKLVESIHRIEKGIFSNIYSFEYVFSARTHSDMETMRRSVAEWKCAHDDCVSTISQTRIEFEAACESIRKGQRTLAQLTDLKVPSPPVLPKVVRLPPVQVVQPSTPACTTISTSVSAVIQPPPAGVIGQPRTPQSNRPGPAPATLPLDESAVPSAAAPAASPWSWSTPLGSLADIRPLRPASEQAHPLLQQQSHHEIWRNGTTTDSSQVVDFIPQHCLCPVYNTNAYVYIYVYIHIFRCRFLF